MAIIMSKTNKALLLYTLLLCVLLLLSCTPNKAAEQNISNQLKILVEDMQRLGGSMDERSKPLLDAWWDTLTHTDQTKELSEQSIMNIEKNMDMLYGLDCFYFAAELDEINLMNICDYFCFKYHERQIIKDDEIKKAYPAEFTEEEDIVLFPDSSVKKLVKDIFGLAQYDLDAYYSALREKYPGELYTEYQNEIVQEYPHYSKYRNREDVYCYFACDPFPPGFEVISYTYLGDNMYYIILSEGWRFDVDTVMLQDMHIVIQETDSHFGFQVISILQNCDQSIIKPHWKIPNGRVD